MATLSTDDRLEIQDLYARYNHAADHGPGEAFAGSFTADGVFAVQGRDPVSGRDALLAMGNGLATRAGTMRHWINNLVLEPTAGGAKGIAYLTMYETGGGKPSAMTRTGEYHDELVKGADGWRFSKRSVVFD
jgi:uncharacterized protein (TIGR02246 family)